MSSRTLRKTRAALFDRASIPLVPLGSSQTRHSSVSAPTLSVERTMQRKLPSHIARLYLLHLLELACGEDAGRRRDRHLCADKPRDHRGWCCDATRRFVTPLGVATIALSMRRSPESSQHPPHEPVLQKARSENDQPPRGPQSLPLSLHSASSMRSSFPLCFWAVNAFGKATKRERATNQINSAVA